MNTGDRIATLIRESVGEPPHQIEVAQVRRRALRRRLRGAALLAALTVALLGGGTAITLVTVQQPAAPRLGQICPLMAPVDAYPRQLPATFRVSTVVWCSIQLVQRPGQGWWLQIVERHAVRGARAYGEALKLPSASAACPPPVMGSSQPTAVFVADRSGHVLAAGVPSMCFTPLAQVKEAQLALGWQPAQVRWVRRLMSDQQAASPCLPDWRQAVTDYSFTGFSPGSRSGLWMQGLVGGDICAVRSTGTSGPVPDDLIWAHRVVRPAVVAALTATPPVPNECRSATQTAYEILNGVDLIGYADLGACRRAVGPDLGPASADLQSLVLQLMAPG
jgi:hypothetical protein